ncbi:MAG: RNA 3'-terminal phosphate cyclase [Methanomassiliicoccales archaeon]
MIEIDGSYGEGGGQLLRMAVALSALTKKEVRVFNIRAGRPNPGLAPQHLAAVKGVATISNAEIGGALAGSKELIFHPGTIRGGRYKIDVGTAGSITLVMQACLLPSSLAEAETVLEISGGTNVKWSPSIDYYKLVFLPLLEKIGIKAKLSIVSRGFYPEGGGRVVVEVTPTSKFKPLHLDDRGILSEISGICFSQNLPEHISRRMALSAKKALIDISDAKILTESSTGISTGAGICIAANFENTVLGSDTLGERGVPAEAVGLEAARNLKEEINGMGTLDIHAADQILAYLALSEDRSQFFVKNITKHLETQIWLIEKFTGARFQLQKTQNRWKVTVVPNRT